MSDPAGAFCNWRIYDFVTGADLRAPRRPIDGRSSPGRRRGIDLYYPCHSLCPCHSLYRRHSLRFCGCKPWDKSSYRRCLRGLQEL